MTIIETCSSSVTSSFSSGTHIGGVTALLSSSATSLAFRRQHSWSASNRRSDHSRRIQSNSTQLIQRSSSSTMTHTIHQQPQQPKESCRNEQKLNSQNTVSTTGTNTIITDSLIQSQPLPKLQERQQQQQPYMEEQQQQQHLILIGGGHAHVQVLKALHGAVRPSHLHVTLIDIVASASYSGMVPGCIAGCYSTSDTQLKLRPLAEFSDIHFLQGTVIDIDLQEKVIFVVPNKTVDKSQQQQQPIRISFDVVSIDIGSTSRGYRTCPGAAQYTIPTRPIDQLIYKLDVARNQELQLLPPKAQSQLPSEEERHPQEPRRRRDLIVIGGGIAGIELSMTITSRWHNEGIPFDTCTIIDANDAILPYENDYTRQTVQTILQSKHIQVRYGAQVSSIDEQFVYTKSVVEMEGSDTTTTTIPIPYTHCIWSTGASAHALSHHLYTKRQLDCDATLHWIRVHPTLQSLSHPFVFAAGDCATIVQSTTTNNNDNNSIIIPSPPKAGVYAVRSGPILIENLTRYLESIRTVQVQQRNGDDNVALPQDPTATTNGDKIIIINGPDNDDRLTLLEYKPQDDFLKILVCGDGTALGFRFGLVLRGEWVFRFKDQIDQSFMKLFDVSGIEKPFDTGIDHQYAIGQYDTQQYDTTTKILKTTSNPKEAALLLLQTDADVDLDQIRVILSTMGNDITYRHAVVEMYNEHIVFDQAAA